MKSKGGFISFNNFLSTSKDRDLSYAFAESNQANPDLVGILFVMEVDPSRLTASFASIAHISRFQGEEEVLFSMHSVFHIQDIKQTGRNNRLYEVNLKLTDDNDPELSRLADYIRKESFPDSEGWYRLGMVLRKMGQFDEAENIYRILLDRIKDNEDEAPIYHQLGTIKYDQEKYQKALTFYEISLAIKQKTLPPDHPDLAISYNIIGEVHAKMGNYSKAIPFYEKVLRIRQQSLSLNHPDLTMSYNNIGLVYENMGNYSKARACYEYAVQIAQQPLSSNHLHLQIYRSNLERVKNK
ncbi:unnamed protein product [Adineta steineri]|uniref:Tetratricopeptide repeat protein n=2 Tax=Adineta steineri TaxID=433720 RepID=A0A814VAC6_9BILA|nr:unnamed protein product [Adineta steineri]